MKRLLRDTLLLTRWHLTEILRNPVWVIVQLFQPLCWLLLFAPILDGMNQTQNILGALTGKPTSALQEFTPGLLVMMSMFGTLFAGFGIVSQLREGFIERLRVTPVHRMALPLSYVMQTVLSLIVQLMLLTGLAVMMGIRPDAGGFVLTLLLMVLIAVMLASVSYALGLILKSEDALAAIVNFLSQPVLLLSGVILPLSFAPALLRTLAQINPLSHAVEASRAMMNGNTTDSSVAISFVMLVVLAGAALFWSMRVFRQATA